MSRQGLDRSDILRGDVEQSAQTQTVRVADMEKQKVQAVLDSFDGDVDVDAFLERLAVPNDIERGEEQIRSGETVPHEVVRKKIERLCQ